MTDPLLILIAFTAGLLVYRWVVCLIHSRRERRRWNEEMRRAVDSDFNEWWGRR